MRKYTQRRHWRDKLPVCFKPLSTLLLLVLSTSVFAAEPSIPGDLRYQVYSSTAAELFWDRATDDGYVIAYEVQINDMVVDSRDALSYFSNALTRGQTYDVQVTAIDDEGDRSAPASLSFIGGDRTIPVDPGPVDPEPIDPDPVDPPAPAIAAPTGLIVSVYSSRSIELFWDRPETFGLTYEVSRDGAVLAITDGVSYFDRELTRDTAYTYNVIAIDLLGVRSPESAITAQTKSGGSVTPEPPVNPEPPIPPTGPVAVPTGLTAKVYSANSAEIFWDRSDIFGQTYEVSRDGTVVATTDGVSFYDRDLARATTYTYEVIAIAPVNRRSDAAAIMLNTSGTVIGDGPGPVTSPTPDDPNIAEPAELYQSDGYSPVKVIRVDLRTAIETGPCNAADETGCTLADVLADTDKFDDHTVDINVHFQSEDFADDGTVSNAELRLRGGGSRFGAQKSFRIKLDSKEELWRGERHLQINKHPFETSRIRNKLAMDVMSEIPNLPSLRTQFVNLWIDDGEGPVDYGLFTHVERVNQYFLRKREWNEDDNIYKAEYFRFAKSDLANLQIDENGEPLDEDAFESTLEIENGEDHRALVDMMTALHDPEQTFDSVLEQYFDRNNVMAWIAANILLHQKDAVRHNFILYNPIGTEKFYFIPWDYDEAMGLWREPPNDLSNDSLRQRLEYGYAVAARNTFLENFYRQPGVHEEILETVEDFRQSYVTDEAMAEKVNHYINLSAAFQYRVPDSVNNPEFTVYSAEKFINAPGENEEALRSRFGVLMAPMLAEPVSVDDEWRFSWQPAHDVTGVAGGISYRLQIANAPTFEADSIFIDIDAIEDAADEVVQSVAVDQLPTGEYFARLIATPANQPTRFWQVSGNKLYYNNQVYYGALRFEAP